MASMTGQDRRHFLKLASGAAATLAAFPPSIRRALAIPAATRTGSIADVQHIVILMQENRSFDHYFGTLRGVRGFGDRHPIPLANGKSVWHQTDGENEVTPFHLNTKTTSALRTPGTPHTFDNAQAAWGQGRLDRWPRFKTPMSMGYYRREDIAFQFALADAFTLCDAHHCSVTTGTDPNRIVFWSGSNFDPQLRARGENCTDANAEVNNLRCQIKGTSAREQRKYSYQGSSFTWPTIPDVLERAGITWRIYQDPNDNWQGLMHGCLAFESFRNSKAGDAIYEKGMTGGWLERFSSDIKRGLLPSVSWILPSQLWSEHPSGSSALQGAEFTSHVLDALTANPEVWSRTALFLTFDENDGLFDHVPPPAPPSYHPGGTLAGKSTLDLRGMYFNTAPDTAVPAPNKYLHPDDNVSGSVRPWGLGPRVPMYVISPWSRGGWVNSQVFDHTSVGQFLEKRFSITVPAISPWHRAICGDLTTCFDFGEPSRTSINLPIVASSSARVAAAEARLPKPTPPTAEPFTPYQEPGIRPSRALPYELHVHSQLSAGLLKLTFRNTGKQGAVFHVYDRLHLDRIPRRYTVEVGKSLADEWFLHSDDARYDLWVYGPNGFVREFRGVLNASGQAQAHPEVQLKYDIDHRAIELIATNAGPSETTLIVRANPYRSDGPWTLRIPRGQRVTRRWSLTASHQWYDLAVSGEHFERRFAGHMETGVDSYSDPAV
jgi:phospholipase C